MIQVQLLQIWNGFTAAASEIDFWLANCWSCSTVFSVGQVGANFWIRCCNGFRLKSSLELRRRRRERCLFSRASSELRIQMEGAVSRECAAAVPAKPVFRREAPSFAVCFGCASKTDKIIVHILTCFTPSPDLPSLFRFTSDFGRQIMFYDDQTTKTTCNRYVFIINKQYVYPKTKSHRFTLWNGKHRK